MTAKTETIAFLDEMAKLLDEWAVQAHEGRSSAYAIHHGAEASRMAAAKLRADSSLPFAVPDRDAATRVIMESGLAALSRDGWAFLRMHHPGFADLLTDLVNSGKMTEPGLVGAAFLIGVILHGERS